MGDTEDALQQLPGQAPTRLPGRDLLVLYGSETGNSQDLAEDLGQCAERLHFSTTVQEMNEIDLVRCYYACHRLSKTGIRAAFRLLPRPVCLPYQDGIFMLVTVLTTVVRPSSILCWPMVWLSLSSRRPVRVTCHRTPPSSGRASCGSVCLQTVLAGSGIPHLGLATARTRSMWPVASLSCGSTPRHLGPYIVLALRPPLSFPFPLSLSFPLIHRNHRWSNLTLSNIRFNWAARKLHKRLDQLGAVQFQPAGEADEQHDQG